MMPKGRYKLMTDYMDKVGTLGKQMMYRTCTVQVNLDFASEADMVKKFRVGLALQPVATALFANSPFLDGKPNGHKSWRSADLARSRPGAHRHAALRVRRRHGVSSATSTTRSMCRCISSTATARISTRAASRSAISWTASSRRCPARCRRSATGPTTSPRSSPRCGSRSSWRCAAPMAGRGGGSARCPPSGSGCIYDDLALDAAWDLVKDWDAETREALRVAASVDGLQGQVGKLHMRQLAETVLDISRGGLRRRARPGFGGMVPDERHFLTALEDSVEDGKTPADELLEHYYGDWNGDLSRIYAEYSY